MVTNVVCVKIQFYLLHSNRTVKKSAAPSVTNLRDGRFLAEWMLHHWRIGVGGGDEWVGEGRQGRVAPLVQFLLFSGENWLNNSFSRPPLELAPLGKS